jgi:hypothetical protein
MTAPISLREALSDDGLLGLALKGDSWATWRACLLAMVGEPLDAHERALFEARADRDPPEEAPREIVVVAGRRAGKDQALSALAVFLACCKDYSRVVKPGELARLMVFAPDLTQAVEFRNRASGHLHASPVLSTMVESETQYAIRLNNGVTIECRSSSYRRLRGMTSIAAICSEAAFYYSEDHFAETDQAILSAIAPSLLTTGGPLILSSSPHARRGELFRRFSAAYGRSGGAMALWGDTSSWNPTVDPAAIEAAYAADPAEAAAAYGAKWRDDLSAFVQRSVIEACVARGIVERPPHPAYVYRAFADFSGNRSDSHGLCIGHTEKLADGGRLFVIDLVREVKPKSDLDQMLDGFAADLRRYNLGSVVGDRYAGDWPIIALRERGIEFKNAKHSASDHYIELLALMNTKRIVLPDVKVAIEQLASLDRSASGKISHPKNGHDDVSACIAGCAYLAQIEDAIRGSFGVFHTNSGLPVEEAARRGIISDSGWLKNGLADDKPQRERVRFQPISEEDRAEERRRNALHVTKLKGRG